MVRMVAGASRASWVVAWAVLLQCCLSVHAISTLCAPEQFYHDGKCSKPPTPVHFDPTKSSTFELHVNKPYLEIVYADTSYLKILTMEEIVALGPIRARSRLGLIISEPTPEFNDVDGILGFGFSNIVSSACFMYTISRRSRPSWGIFQPDDFLTVAKPRFAFFATQTHAELQLGGHDPRSVKGPLKYTKMLNASGYGMNLTSVRYGTVELLQHWGPIVAVLDTGATCITFPSLPVETSQGGVESPYDRLLGAAHRLGANQTMTITTADGQRHTLPSSDWTHPNGCVSSHRLPFNVLILGDPFFRRFVVMHDMSTPVWRLGIGEINPDYKLLAKPETNQTEMGIVPVPHSHHAAHAQARISRSTHAVHKVHLTRTHRTPNGGIATGVTKLPVRSLRIRYTMELGVGTPLQPMTLIFDTGSTLLAVFPKSSYMDRLRHSRLMAVIMYASIGMVVVFLVGNLLAFLRQRRQQRGGYTTIDHPPPGEFITSVHVRQPMRNMANCESVSYQTGYQSTYDDDNVRSYDA